MESLSDYLLYWGLYFLAGLAGLWCWGRMAFWVKQRGLFYHLYSAIGAILIFTPVPVAGDMPIQLAPGVIVLLFSVISDGLGAVNHYALVYGASATLAFSVVFVGVLAGLTPDDNGDKKREKARANLSRSAKRTDPII